MATAELTTVPMWYDQHDAGDPCVLLHPGGAGVDARALGPTVEGLARAFRVFTPEQRGHGRTPDLVRRLVFVAGVFHHDGWADGVLDGEPPEFLRQSYSELSPDGIGHYQQVVAKLAAMHATEPALCNLLITEFLARDPVATFAPIRRTQDG